MVYRVSIVIIGFRQKGDDSLNRQTSDSSFKPAKRFLPRLLRGLLAILCAIALLVAILAGIQYFGARTDRANNPAPGKLVSVLERQMHVYTEGEGDTTYVFLSGGGIGAPLLEYRPLWSRFAEHGRVAVVEYFGYGWSDDTDAPRTLDAVVSEIRKALSGADIQPPYVLVAHSLGGLYAMRYAGTYPDELEAIVALDTTLPRAYLKAQEQGLSRQQMAPQLEPVALLRKLGVLRALLWFDPLLVSGAPDGVYRDEEARRIAMVTSWNYASDALLNEFATLPDNMAELLDFSFPKSIPVLMIQASPPGEDSEASSWSLAERQRLVEPLNQGKVVELPAGHSGIYWLMSEDIVQETLAFLDK